MISQDQKVAVSDQIAKTVAYLEKLNHGASSIARHCATWKKFGKYCETQNAEFFSVDLAMSFLSDVFGITESSALKSFQKVRRRHMRVLCDFFLCGHVVQKPQWRAYYFPPQCKHVFEAFMTLRFTQRDGVFSKNRSRNHPVLGTFRELSGRSRGGAFFRNIIRPFDGLC